MDILSALKAIGIPSGAKVKLDAHEIWRVEWWSTERTARGGLGRSSPRVEVFTCKEDAVRFADQIKAAAKLLGDVSNGLWGDTWGPRIVKSEYRGI